MTPLPPESVLDDILAVQFSVAWAGEALCEPPRLGWWKTDLIDPEGGGDLLARLLPCTYVWAKFQAVREAARHVEARLRRSQADPDRLLTLFHLGAEVDAHLLDRIELHKRTALSPAERLPELYTRAGALDSGAFARWLGSLAAVQDFQVVPGGRALPFTPEPLDRTVRRLAAALVPLAPTWPLPFARKPA